MRLHRNVRELRQGSQLAHAGPRDSKTARPEVGGSAQRLSTDLAALGNKLLFSSQLLSSPRCLHECQSLAQSLMQTLALGIVKSAF